MTEIHTEGQSRTPSPRVKNLRNILLNIAIALLVVVVGYLSYSFVQRNFIEPRVDAERAGHAAGEIIQIDVLNGCGVNGAASAVTSYLRLRGYDVVEMRNYKTFDVEQTLVIDRAGNLENAGKVAHALGLNENNIIQQLNADYYVDISVVIGKDYNSLKPFQ